MAYRIEDIISDVVTKTNTKLNLSFDFLTGKLIEVNEIINEITRGETGADLFPLCWLVQNIKLKHPSELESKLAYDYEVDLSIFFITDADQNAKSNEAFINNIHPKLTPFCEKFIELIQKSRYIFTNEDPLNYETTNLAKVGSDENNKNKFNKQCDAILLSINNLKINKQTNCNT